MAEILYRKWRPRTFAELFGQEHVATTLTNALASGRVAHAYLFAGPRGTGKTSTGRLLGKALNCAKRQDGEPCNECESCLSFLAGRAMDLIELDAASNRGIDEIRSLREKVAFAPGAGAYKVYLIDEVHMLTDAAFNALLKTLEEPPPHVVFMLATTEAHKVPATISSRCQRFDFRRAPLGSMVKNLERICEGEGLKCEPAALELIARSATGSHRDAVNLLDQLVTSYGSDLTIEHVRTGLGLIGDERSARLARLALAGDLAGGLSLIASVRDDGLDLRQFQRELVSELRALLMAKSGLAPEEGATEERRRDLQAAVADIPTSRVLTALRAFGEADLKPDPNSTLPLDIALAECALADGQTGRRAEAQNVGQSGNQAIGQEGSGQTGARGNMQTDGPVRPVARPRPGESPSETAPAPRGRPWREPVEGRTAGGSKSSSQAVNAPPPSPAAPDAPPNADANGGASSEPVELQMLRENMRQIYQKARAAQFQVGALINSVCDIIEANDSSVTFGFKFQAQVDKISEPHNLKTLVEAVSSVSGRELEVRCICDPNVTDWKQREASSRSPLVRAAQELGARVISDEPEANP